MLNWPLRLEKRAEPLAVMRIAAPLIAIAAMLMTGYLVFAILGQDPLQALMLFFITPVDSL
jgi:simple sugar transport system permease protein